MGNQHRVPAVGSAGKLSARGQLWSSVIRSPLLLVAGAVGLQNHYGRPGGLIREHAKPDLVGPLHLIEPDLKTTVDDLLTINGPTTQACKICRSLTGSLRDMCSS